MYRHVLLANFSPPTKSTSGLSLSRRRHHPDPFTPKQTKRENSDSTGLGHQPTLPPSPALPVIRQRIPAKQSPSSQARAPHISWPFSAAAPATTLHLRLGLFLWGKKKKNTTHTGQQQFKAKPTGQHLSRAVARRCGGCVPYTHLCIHMYILPLLRFPILS